jgi:secretion/DNA translocation related TadE-like protein
VLVVAMIGVLLLVGAALGVVTAMVRAHRIAQAGADLAALAGAHGLALGRDGCLEAGRIAAANDVRLTGCRVEGRALWVTVQATGPHWLGQTADLSAEARAGPA